MKNKPNLEIVETGKIILQLYITGMSENSVRAIQNITKFCDMYLKDRCDLEIIDIYKNPAVAEEQKIVFSPSLIRQLPLPRRMLIGDLSDTKKILNGLGINFKE